MGEFFERLPAYERSGEVRAIQDSYEQECIRALEAAERAMAQLFIGSADRALDEWERMLDLTPDASLPLEERRARALAKLRGTGTATVEMSAGIAGAAAERAEVVEFNTDSYFLIKLFKLMAPSAFEKLMGAVAEAKPAHLGVKYALVENPAASVMHNTGTAVAAMFTAACE